MQKKMQKTMQKKWLLVWEMQKKCKKKGKKMQKKRKKSKKNAKKRRKKCEKNIKKHDSRAGKVAFLEFPGRPHFSGLSRPPPTHFTPDPVFEPALHPEPGEAGPKTNSPGQAPLPYPSSPPAGFPRVSVLVPCIWYCHEITKGLSW